MPAIDREKLAYHVSGALSRAGLSYREARGKWPGVTPGTLSRICNGIEVSAANLLAVCKALSLDPFDFLDLEKPNPRSRFGMSHHDRKQGISTCSSSSHT